MITKYRIISILLTILLFTSSFSIWGDVAEAAEFYYVSGYVQLFDYDIDQNQENFVKSLSDDFDGVTVQYCIFVNCTSIAPGELTVRLPSELIKDKSGEYAQDNIEIQVSCNYSDYQPMHTTEEIENYEGDLSEISVPLCYNIDSEGICTITNYKEIDNTDFYNSFQATIQVVYPTRLPTYFFSMDVPTDPLYMDLEITNDTPENIHYEPILYTNAVDYIVDNHNPRIYLDNSNSGTAIFIDANLFLKGQTITGKINKINFFRIGENSYPFGDRIRELNDIEKEYFSNHGIALNDNIYVIDKFPYSELNNLYSTQKNNYIQTNFAYHQTMNDGTTNANLTNRSNSIAKTDPTLTTNQSSPNNSKPLDPLSPDVKFPCLYIGAFTSTLGYLNGYWSELGETNTVGYNQYETEKLGMTLDENGHCANKIELPANTIKVSGKVYDYYSDDDFTGASMTRFNSGPSNSTSCNYYYKFNDALSDYYKGENQRFYDFYYTQYGLRDDNPDPNTIYSQTYGILNPLYIGRMTIGPIYGSNTSYGLFGLDKSSTFYFDPITQTAGNVTSVNRIRAITIAAQSITGNSVGNGCAFMGIMSDHLGTNLQDIPDFLLNLIITKLCPRFLMKTSLTETIPLMPQSERSLMQHTHLTTG